MVLPCRYASRPDRVDVELRAGTARRFGRARISIGCDDRAGMWFWCGRLPDGSTYLRWAGLFEFLVSRDARQILYRALERATPESFNVYLLGQVLSFSLLAFGIEPLHGTVVSVNGEAIAFVGDCGYGKSTLAAAFLDHGFRIVTDDVIALVETRSGWTVQPGLPRIKLFPSIARRAFGADHGGTPMNQGTSKLVVRLADEHALDRPARLKAIYVLSDPRSRRTDGARPRIDRLAGTEAFLEVIRASFNLLVYERARLANQFAFATRLVRTVPVNRLTYPRRLSQLAAVRDAVLADLE